MTYLALLRGVNVGGKNKVEMARLKKVFESIGFGEVRTYINSGNVIFVDDRAATKLRSLIEKAIAAEFGFSVRVVLRDLDSVELVTKAIPASWRDDSTMRCYVMFLWEEADEPTVLERLTIKEDLDDVKYVPGAVIWRVDRDKLTRSGMMRLTSDELYKAMTIRNVNTVRKLADMMNAT
ncbi:MAG: DUF1697 domain-containing protein [Acidimicrobiia bacterium]